MKSFICLWFLLCVMDQSVCGDPVNITAEPGQNVTLTCRADRNGVVTVVKLTRDDLQPQYVLFYRNEQIDEKLQNPQYKNRTKLQSLISSDGKVHLTLNSVTEKDSGEYECRVKTEIKSNTRRKRAALESTFIHLSVAATQSDPPPGRGHIGLVAGLMICALVILAALTAVLILKKRESFRSLSPHDEAENPQNVDMRVIQPLGNPQELFILMPVPSPDKWRGLCEEVSSTDRGG